MNTQILNKKGQGLTEYIVLLLLISVISIGAVKGLGSAITGKIDEAKRHINSVSGNPDKGGGEGGEGSGGGLAGELRGAMQREIGRQIFGH